MWLEVQGPIFFIFRILSQWGQLFETFSQKKKTFLIASHNYCAIKRILYFDYGVFANQIYIKTWNTQLFRQSSLSVTWTDTEPAWSALNGGDGAGGRVPRERRGGRHPVQQRPRLSAHWIILNWILHRAEKQNYFKLHISPPMEPLFVNEVHLNKIWVVRKCPTFFPACYIGTWGTIDGELVGGTHWVAVSVRTAVAEVFVGHVAEGGALAGWGRGRDVEEAWVPFCCGRGPAGDQEESIAAWSALCIWSAWV